MEFGITRLVFDGCDKEIQKHATAIRDQLSQYLIANPSIRVLVMHNMSILPSFFTDAWNAKAVKIFDPVSNLISQCTVRETLLFYKDANQLSMTLSEDQQRVFDALLAELQKSQPHLNHEKLLRDETGIITMIKNTLIELGPYCAQQVVINQTPSGLSKKRKADTLDTPAFQKLPLRISPLVKCLLDKVEHEIKNHGIKKIQILIVTEKTVSAENLCHLFQLLSDTKFPGLVARYLTGRRISLLHPIWDQALSEFKQRKCHILILTKGAFSTASL